MHRPRLALICGALLLAPLAACSSSDDAAPATTTASDDGAGRTSTTVPGVTAEAYTGDDDGFYDLPDPLPDAPHGTLLRYQERPARDGVEATEYRILYLSESVAGEPIAVSGMASVPEAAAPEDGRPVVTIAHGTTGIADECAPSVQDQNGEMRLVQNAGADTYLIAATDYEGLGTPGRHPYLVGESEGRSTLDAALAVRQLPQAEAGDQLGIVGYSQGGHGALWANQLAAEWAPDFDVVGTFSGAPASEIGVIIAAAAQVKAFSMMVIAGIAEAYPEADPAEILTPKGQELLEVVDTGCAAQTFQAVGSVDGKELIVPGGPQSETWSSLAVAQDAGQEKTNDAPVLLIHAKTDLTVPKFFIDQVEKRMCANGQVVERIELPTGEHAGAAVPAYDQAMTWMAERFEPDADPISGTCP